MLLPAIFYIQYKINLVQFLSLSFLLMKNLVKFAVQSFDVHCCYMGTAIKHPVPDWVKPSFDIRAL